MFSTPSSSLTKVSSNTRNTATLSIVDHVFGRRAELAVALDDLVDAIEEVFLRHALSSRTNGKHARLGTHASELGAGSVGAKARQELVAYTNRSCEWWCGGWESEWVG